MSEEDKTPNDQEEDDANTDANGDEGFYGTTESDEKDDPFRDPDIHVEQEIEGQDVTHSADPEVALHTHEKIQESSETSVKLDEEKEGTEKGETLLEHETIAEADPTVDTPLEDEQQAEKEVGGLGERNPDQSYYHGTDAPDKQKMAGIEEGVFDGVTHDVIDSLDHDPLMDQLTDLGDHIGAKPEDVSPDDHLHPSSDVKTEGFEPDRGELPAPFPPTGDK